MKPASTLFIPTKPKTRNPRKPKSAPPRESRARVTGDVPAADASRPALPDPVVPRPSQLDGRWLNYVKSFIRDVPDFPKPGILFKDITPMLADPRAFHITLDLFAERFIGEHIDVVVGVESRGFIFGGALAARLNASFVPVRKPGKLPYKTDA